MAPFNKRQIGYIQAIAGRQQHVSLISGSHDNLISSYAGTGEGPPTKSDPSSMTSDAGAFKDNFVVCAGLAHSGTDGIANHPARKSLLIKHYLLDNPELGYDARESHNDDKLLPGDFTGLNDVQKGLGQYTTLNVFECPVEGTHNLYDTHHDAAGDNSTNNPALGEHVNSVPVAAGELVRNPDRIPSTARATPDGYLVSTNVKFRFTLPTTLTSNAANNPMGQDHYEFRWIVWRSKRPTMSMMADDSPSTQDTNLEAIRDGCSFRNPGYDFFMGQNGRKRGFLGYTLNANLDAEKDPHNSASESYSGVRWDGSSNTFVTNAGGESNRFTDLKSPGDCDFTVDDIMTMRINRDDYVVMKDVRFFLGKEHGKSHFEDTLHWDWNDPIDTPSPNMLSSPTLNNKNYRWHMTLFGTSGGPTLPALVESVRWTTKVESG